MNVLIIIDMQEASFVNLDKHDSEGVISRINKLSTHTREAGGKVIFIQHDGTIDEGLFPSTPGWEILLSLVRADSDIVVRKTINDSFCDTQLNRILRELNASKIIISGWATDYCVDSTVRSAVSLGHNVVVVSDCHTVSNRPHLTARQVIEHHNWTWKNLLTASNSIQVLQLSEWCNQIEY
jgi:nicotinamidase-related amidase